LLGGGLGGLAFAQAMKSTPIETIIFERDLSLKSRARGYHIGLNKDRSFRFGNIEPFSIGGSTVERKANGLYCSH
jgi:hypothetical protein